MKLVATIAYETDLQDLSYVTFFDHEREYGFSLSRYAETAEIELMVADQSVYRAHGMVAHLERGRLAIKLAPGTIAAMDGEDEYEIVFADDDVDFGELISAFNAVFGKQVQFTYSL